MTVIPDLHDDGHLRRVLYMAAILLVVIPTLQVGFQLWPLQLASIQWRFGAMNMVSGSVLLPWFLGLSLFLTLARQLDRGGAQRVVGVLATLSFVGVAAALVLFVLDTQELQAIVSAQAESQFRSTATRVMAVSGTFLLSFLLLVVASFNAPARTHATGRKSGGARKKEGEDLFVGQDAS